MAGPAERWKRGKQVQGSPALCPQPPEIVLGLTAALFIGSLFLIRLVGSEFMPAADEGEVRVTAEMEVGTRLGITDEKMQTMMAIVRKRSPGSRELCREHRRLQLPCLRFPYRRGKDLSCSLRRKDSGRPRKSPGPLGQLSPTFPGVRTRIREGQGFFLLRMGQSGGDRIQIDIRGYDLDIADALAAETVKLVEKVDGITDARASRESGTPEDIIVINRQKAADMKLTVSQIANTLQTFLSGTRAGNYRDAGEEFWIRVLVKDAETISMDELLDLTLTNSEGQRVMLRNVVNVEQAVGTGTDPEKGPGAGSDGHRQLHRPRPGLHYRRHQGRTAEPPGTQGFHHSFYRGL